MMLTIYDLNGTPANNVELGSILILSAHESMYVAKLMKAIEKVNKKLVMKFGIFILEKSILAC